MAVERAFIVKLIADTKELSAGLNAVGVEAEKTLGSAMNKVALASAAAFAGIAAFAFKAGEAAIQDAAEQEKLATTLRNVTGATDEAIASTEEYIANMARVTTFSDSEMRPALEQLVRSTGDLASAQELLGLAQDLAVGTGQPLVATAEALARAQSGNMKSLQALSPALRDNIKDGESFDSVLRELTATFGGQAAAAAGTLQGQMVILRNRFSEVVENIGTALLPAIEGLIGLLGKFASFAENNTGLILGLGAAVATFTGIIVAAAIGMKLYATAAAIATAANTAFGISLTATGVGAIVVVIGLLVGAFVTAMAKSEGFRNAVLGMLNGIIGGLELFVNSFIGAWNWILEKIRKMGPVLKAVGIDVSNLGPVGEVSFGRLGAAADSAANKINNVAIQTDLAASRLAAANLQNGIVSVSDAQTKLAITTARVNELRAQAVKGGTSIDALNQALKDQQTAQSVLNTLLGDTAKRTGGASKATEEAKSKSEQYTEVLKKAQGASDSYERSTRRLRDAKKSLEQADSNLAAAQEALTKAQQAGSPEEIADAQRALAAAERNVTRGKFGAEQATFAVRDAERKLAEVRGNSESTAQDVREAEIALEEAKLRVKDQEDEQINTTRRLDEARRQLRIATEGLREGDKELIPLKDAVTRAEEEQTRAAEAHRDAVKEQTSAIEDYRKALEELNKTIANMPKVAGRIGQPGLVPIDGVVTPTPAAAGMGPNPQAQTPVIVNVTAGIGGNAYQVGKEIIEVLDQYTSVAGPLDTLMRVA
jgi:hypothetical protein